MLKKILLLNILLLFCVSNFIRPQEKNDPHISVLINKLSNKKGPERLKYLLSLSNAYWNVPKQEYWAIRLYKESLANGSLGYAEDALATLANYYHNSSNEIELKRVCELSKQLALKKREYSDQYFTIQSFGCQLYLWKEKFGEAIYQTTNLYRLAIAVNNKKGLVSSEEILGMIYQLMGMNRNALIHIEKALSTLKATDNSDYSYIAQLTTTVIEIELELNKLPEALSYIQSFEQIQKDVLQGKYGANAELPVERNKKLTYVYYMDYFLRSNKPERAKICMDKAGLITESDSYVDFLYKYEKALYLKSKGDNEKALSLINSVIKEDGGNTVKYRVVRAEIYAALGYSEKASQEFKTCLTLQQDSNSTNLERQVAYLQHVYDTMQLQLSLKNSELHTEEIKANTLVWIVISLVVIIAIFIALLIRNVRLRKLLSKDKKVLRESEVELRSALRKAAEVEKLKNSFIENVSHEIRTPLNAIVGFTSIIVEEVKDKQEYEDYCNIIEQNNRSLSELINNLLDIALLQSSDKNLDEKELVACEVKVLCKNAVERLLRKQIIKSEVSLTFCNKEQENYLLTTDKKRLDKILDHLLTNAAKCTEKGSITLEYKIDYAHNEIAFIITDTGIGIKKEAREHIFDSFEKANTFIPGLGLGLTICRLMAQQLGGRIYLDNEYTSGARFVFTHTLDLLNYKRNNSIN